MNRILIIVCIVALLLGGYLLYRQHTTGSAMGDGQVTENQSASEKSAMNSGATTSSTSTDLDGQSIEAHPTPSRSDAPGTINTEPVAPGASTNQAPASQAPAPLAAQQGTLVGPNGRTVVGPGAAVPAGDSIAPNPPNGAVFTGTGKFQWYRQGNITWRVDSGSGSYCIAFATMEEWQKPIVYQNGCGTGRG